ncbi:hypothetical protein [Rhodococcus oryzae]|uniref:hypothetical protein n=1 Tax=Rhodococcus oryzae TaxID=2571143 RepID=UPI00378B00C7
MITLNSIVRRASTGVPGGPPDWNPFRCGDLLQECSLIELTSDAIESRVAMIIDLRTGLGEEGGDTGIMVVEAVTHFAWSGQVAAARPMLRTIVGFHTRIEPDAVALRFDLTPESHLTITGGSARYFEGLVPGLGAAQPDLGAGEYRSVEGGFADWSSECDVLYSFDPGVRG